MKTSIKLLIGIAVAVLLTMIGAGWSFRQQYDQLDHSDPFAQFTKQALPAFRVLKLVGDQGERFLVQPGVSPILRIQPEHQAEVSYRTIGDTLLVRYKLSYPDTEYDELHAGDAHGIRPAVVVTTPMLQAVLVERATCKVANWNVANLTLTQLGPKGAFALADNRINSLQASLMSSGLLSAEDKNTVAQATITLKDKASFLVGQTAFTALTLHADSAATLLLPGALLAKIK